MSDGKQAWNRAELDKLGVEKAHSFQIFVCEDPYCGPHIIPTDVAGKPLCEMVIGYQQVPNVIEWLMDYMEGRRK